MHCSTNSRDTTKNPDLFGLVMEENRNLTQNKKIPDFSSRVQAAAELPDISRHHPSLQHKNPLSQHPFLLLYIRPNVAVTLP